MMWDAATLLVGLGGALLGASLISIVAAAIWRQQKRVHIEALATAEDTATQLQRQNQQAAIELAELRAVAQQLENANADKQRLTEQVQHWREAHGRLEEQLRASQEQAKEKLELLEQAKEQLSQQFKLLAQDILEDKSRRFTELNQKNLGELLNPVRSKLGEFQAKVEQFYDSEGKQRSALAAQVRELFSLNRSLSEDAQNLTRALKGESKTRGNWGELVLERILQSLGLERGREYEVQVSQMVDGVRLQPDVVIHLPEDRHIVVDSKVSLVDWEAAHAAEDDASRQAALRRHRDSLRTHIRQLASKNYQDLYGIQSLDCVVMFVPIEPALLSVVADDGDLFQHAWQQQVLLVSASTLFFALRTVAYLWRQDAQNRNAQEIASRGAELYDKLNGFVQEMDRVGDHLQRAQDAFGTASKRLVAGRGNVIRQAEMLRELGVKPKKLLPQSWRDDAQREAAALAPSEAESKTESP
nr:DNA recombination protein RmuC [Oceanococcus sp. HetDA_MAG_MS8]